MIGTKGNAAMLPDVLTCPGENVSILYSGIVELNETQQIKETKSIQARTRTMHIIKY